AAQAPGPARFDEGKSRATIRTLSSDEFGGRAPASAGEKLTTEYISSQFKRYGLLPANHGSFLQEVPLVQITANTDAALTVGGATPLTLSFGRDLSVSTPRPQTTVALAGSPLVFAGYGIVAPEYQWNDYAGLDAKGKTVVVLVNDPGYATGDPKLFHGKAMTYYGRWTYKYEEAERRGAAGVLIVHTTGPAGYPWHVVVNSNSSEHGLLPRDPSLPAPIGVRGWITDSAATALLSQAGLSMTTLRKQAESRDFRPVSTGIIIDESMQNSLQHMSANNVVGVVRGIDPKLRDEYVAYSAHWDHFGIGPVVNGDSIYNGSVDNGSGVASVLTIAHAAAEGVKPRRSQLFIFVTAEESGLLGSAYFAEHPTVPASKIVAALNMDIVPVNGRVRDLNVLGDNKSSLGPTLARLVRSAGIRISPDAHPEAGHFYRSDHFSFAKAGIPSVSIGGGVDYVGRPSGWGL